MNAGDTHQGNKNAPQVQAASKRQVTFNPPAMKDGEVREALVQNAQAITTQAKQIMAQANREVVPCENKHDRTMASRLRDFTRMNPLIFLDLKLIKTPKTFLMRFTKFCLLWG